MKYAPDFSPDSARHHLVELVKRSGLHEGVMLDLGCGRAAVAEPLTDLGFSYVGTDIDVDALAAITAEGVEAHELDLRADGPVVRARVEEILAGRPLAGVLAIDVLEHVADPSAVLDVLRELVVGGEPRAGAASLFTSIPNVSHLDVAAKLLIGRFDYLPIGLLDETHLRFFTDAGLHTTMTRAGWREVDHEDVVAPVTEQLFPADAPVLRPEAPARELLARLRRHGDDHAFTFQFIRRYEPGEPAEPDSDAPAPDVRPFASVVIANDPDADGSGRVLDALLADLARQRGADFEVLVSAGAGTIEPDPRLRHPVRRVPAGDDDRAAAVAVARGRYVCFLDAHDRVHEDWIAALDRKAHV